MSIVCWIILPLALYVIWSIVFWKTHQRPLNDKEIAELSRVRRIEYINTHFRFSQKGYRINPQYRESLDKRGRWDKIPIPFEQIGSFLTELLRFKRHEWFVWVLTDEISAKLIWANKGDDNESCYFRGSRIQLVLLAANNQCNTVICFHNHPHTKDRYGDLLSPSDTDLRTYSKLKEFYNERGLNFIDGLCTQGRFIIYGQSFSDTYFPVTTSQAEIRSENAICPKNNYKLHKELRKKKRIRMNSLTIR